MVNTRMVSYQVELDLGTRGVSYRLRYVLHHVSTVAPEVGFEGLLVGHQSETLH
jgi:hypothetical protein